MAQNEWGGYRSAQTGYPQDQMGQRPVDDGYPHASSQPYGQSYAQTYGQTYGRAEPQLNQPMAGWSPRVDEAGYDEYAEDDQAYYHAEDDGALPPSSGGTVGRLANVAGAIVSLSLIAGLGVWGYKLAVRDVTGVPVVQALEGPMRIQPEDPGGQAAAHQGLAVNSVAAEGQAEGPAEQVALAPSAATLADEDMPVEARVTAVPGAEAGEPAPVAGDLLPEATPALADLTDAGTDPIAAALALADQLTAGVAPLDEGEVDLAMTEDAPETGLSLDAAVESAVAEAAAMAQIIPASVPGVSSSPIPPARPAGLVMRAAASPTPVLTTASAATTEVAPEDIPVGTRLVQLGAFDSEEVARSEWDVLVLKFSEYLDGKTRVIEKAQSGGKTFYRLRAMGFADLADARRFCSALMAGQAACIPVVTR